MKKSFILLFAFIFLIFIFSGCSNSSSGYDDNYITDSSAYSENYEFESSSEYHSEVQSPNENVYQKEYNNFDDFYIEGKWKSVGSYGFGQAQPGSIVIFNGTNCNFFVKNMPKEK